MSLDERYYRALQALAPRGDAWPTDEQSVWNRLLNALSQTFLRVDQRAAQLIEEADPRTAAETIAEWEELCGLPCDCVADEAPTDLQGRRAAVVAHIMSDLGLSISALESMCGALGWSVQISEYRPFRAGLTAVGQALNTPSAGWPFAFSVEADRVPVRLFQVGSSVAGDRLAKWGNQPLECLISTAKPAETIAIHKYGQSDDDLPKEKSVQTFHVFRAGKSAAGDPLEFFETRTYRRALPVEITRESVARSDAYPASKIITRSMALTAGSPVGVPLLYSERFTFQRGAQTERSIVNPQQVVSEA